MDLKTKITVVFFFFSSHCFSFIAGFCCPSTYLSSRTLSLRFDLPGNSKNWHLRHPKDYRQYSFILLNVVAHLAGHTQAKYWASVPWFVNWSSGRKRWPECYTSWKWKPISLIIVLINCDILWKFRADRS